MVNKRKKGRRGGMASQYKRKTQNCTSESTSHVRDQGIKTRIKSKKSEHTYAQGTNEGVTD